MNLNKALSNCTGCFLALLLSVFSIPLNAYSAASDHFGAVQKIYVGYHQRPADPVGLIYWSQRLDAANGNLNGIIHTLANSPEFQNIYGPINGDSIFTVVSAVFQVLFGRDADSESLGYYVSGFNTGQFTAATIVLNVLDGATGDDLKSLNNKLEAANLFTRTIDPDLDERNFQAAYEGDGDVIAGRNFLALYATSAKVPTQAETAAYIRANIAIPGDPIVSRASDGSRLSAPTGQRQTMAAEASIITVQQCYIAYYGRPADPLGLDYWATALDNSGGDLAAIIEAFGTSEEATALHAGQNTVELVNSLYRQMFNRDADIGGIIYYTHRIAWGESTLSTVMLDILYGAQNADACTLGNKLAAAQAFTAAIDTTPEIIAYGGDAAAETSRVSTAKEKGGKIS